MDVADFSNSAAVHGFVRGSVGIPRSLVKMSERAVEGDARAVVARPGIDLRTERFQISPDAVPAVAHEDVGVARTVRVAEGPDQEGALVLRDPRLDVEPLLAVDRSSEVLGLGVFSIDESRTPHVESAGAPLTPGREIRRPVAGERDEVLVLVAVDRRSHVLRLAPTAAGPRDEPDVEVLLLDTAHRTVGDEKHAAAVAGEHGVRIAPPSRERRDARRSPFRPVPPRLENHVELGARHGLAVQHRPAVRRERAAELVVRRRDDAFSDHHGVGPGWSAGGRRRRLRRPPARRGDETGEGERAGESGDGGEVPWKGRLRGLHRDPSLSDRPPTESPSFSRGIS